MPFGFIYKITSLSSDKVYIGSTKQKYLCQRKAKHLDDYKGFLIGTRKYKSSYEILKLGDAVFQMIERYQFNHVSELRRREYELMKDYPTKVNIHKACRIDFKDYIKENL